MNVKLREQFYAALKDPTLLSLNKSAALIDALISNAMGRVKKKAVTDQDENRLTKLMDQQRGILESIGRQERFLGMHIRKDLFGKYLDETMKMFREVTTDLDKLKDIQRRQLMLGEALMASGTVDREGASDDE